MSVPRLILSILIIAAVLFVLMPDLSWVGPQTPGPTRLTEHMKLRFAAAPPRSALQLRGDTVGIGKDLNLHHAAPLGIADAVL